MALYRHVQTAFWQDAKVLEEMTPEDKLFYLYLMTNPQAKQIGVYPITKKTMAYEIGYSAETINSLVERFENYHKVIKYNSETREIALLNWGKYNFNKGGKPVEDCVKKELKEIKDISLLALVAERIENSRIKSLYDTFLLSNVTTDDTYHDTLDDTSTTRYQKEKEKEKEKEKNTSRLKFETCDMENAHFLFRLMLENNPTAKQPNFDKWANEFRLIREKDGKTVEQIQYLIKWAQQDTFWKANVLSPSTLRKKWDQLQIKAISEHQQRKNVKQEEPPISSEPPKKRLF